jgi:uncharacterized protein (TIGR00255 family)
MMSMTGFGRSEHSGPSASYRCEIKSVNSRFIEVNIRLPRSMAEIESELISLIKEKLQRGKIDCFIEIQFGDSQSQIADLNSNSIQKYLQQLNQIQESIRADFPALAATHLNIVDILRLDGATLTKAGGGTQVSDEHREGILGSLNQAIAQLQISRQREGQSLKTALKSLVQEISQDRASIESLLPSLREKLRANYLKRLQNSVAQIAQSMSTTQMPTEDRIATEIAILLDKMDIDEEITRLKTHETEFLRLLDQEATGRKLDFMCQEMHREVNTMSNKAVQTDCAKITVNMKQTIERIRQQVQNIE